MRQGILAYLKLWGTLALMCLVMPRLAFAGAVGVITGQWRLWNRLVIRALGLHR